jgi:rfaE bifunctional protein nucleotidyltransferase chain/domain
MRAVDFEAKICPPERLAPRLEGLARPLVFTNGVFDILHRGHVTYLAQARSLGASLLLALNSDASAKRLGKGDNRPFNTMEDRAAVVAALEAVDLVSWFDEDTPYELISAVPRCWSKAATGRSTRSSAHPRCSPGAARYTRSPSCSTARPRDSWPVSAAARGGLAPQHIEQHISLDSPCSSRPAPASGATCGR